MEACTFETYQGESELPAIIELIEKDLSEPYSVFTYRYFINNFPRLCITVRAVRGCLSHH